MLSRVGWAKLLSRVVAMDLLLVVAMTGLGTAAVYTRRLGEVVVESM